MILAALALALQPAPAGALLDPQTASQSFLSICMRHVGDPAALRAAIRASPMGFVRERDSGSFEVYRAGQAEFRFEPGLGCAFEASLPSRSDGVRAIDLVAEATGRPARPGGTSRGGTFAFYRWQEPAPGEPGLSARLDWHRLGAPADAPATLSLWVYLRSER